MRREALHFIIYTVLPPVPPLLHARYKDQAIVSFVSVVAWYQRDSKELSDRSRITSAYVQISFE